jgi:hypothetical protein
MSEYKKSKDQSSLPDITDELIQSTGYGVGLAQIVQEILNNKNVVYLMNALNLSNTIIINVLYLYRTYNMCMFDKEPIWKIPDEMEQCGG